jgi:hypothetical protein
MPDPLPNIADINERNAIRRKISASWPSNLPHNRVPPTQTSSSDTSPNERRKSTC